MYFPCGAKYREMCITKIKLKKKLKSSRREKKILIGLIDKIITIYCLSIKGHVFLVWCKVTEKCAMLKVNK